MSLTGRLGLVGRIRSLKLRGSGGGSQKWFSEGVHEPQGLLFNETPPPPGVKRQWESWEAPWYFTFGAATAILTLGLSAKPDTSLSRWADRQAAEKLGPAP